MLFLGVDLGSTNLKACLYDTEKHVVLAAENAPTPGSGTYVDADPLIRSLLELSERVIAKGGRKLRDIAGMALSSQMHGLLLADRENQALTPFLTWQNRSAQPFLEEVRARTGLKSMKAGHTVSLWYALKKRERIPARAARIFLLAEYVVTRLTGKLSPCHKTNAQSTGALKRTKKDLWDWNAAALQEAALSLDFLPELKQGVERVGEIQGLDGMPVYLPIGDQQASLLESGLGEGSRDSVNIGTGAQVSRFFTEEEGFEESAKFEVRPFLGPNVIATIPGLPGGAYLKTELQKGVAEDVVCAEMARLHRLAYEHLPNGGPQESALCVSGSLLRGDAVLQKAFQKEFQMQLLFSPNADEAPVGSVLAAVAAAM